MSRFAGLALVGATVLTATPLLAWKALSDYPSRSLKPWRLDKAASALPPPAQSAFHVPHPTALHDGGSTTWAPIRRRVLARTAPSAQGGPIAILRTRTPEGTTNLAVVRGVKTSEGRLWVHLSLAVLPNGTEGWVPRSALGGYTVVDTRLVVSLGALRATLYRGDRQILIVPVGIGTRLSPTPQGTFYIRNKLTSYASSFYGPVAFGTSARSEVLTDWPAGGFVGIHGTDRPDLIPGRISHGCIRLRNPDIVRLSRLLQVGSPVVIHA
jgi:lipoprotein-anchoring transpeptidase ErfK/SrfK